MAIPPELEVRQYASSHGLRIIGLSRSATLMVVTFERIEKLVEILEKMVTHYSKRSSIDVDKHIQSIVFIKREVPNVSQDKKGE